MFNFLEKTATGSPDCLAASIRKTVFPQEDSIKVRTEVKIAMKLQIIKKVNRRIERNEDFSAGSTKKDMDRSSFPAEFFLLQYRLR